MATVVRGLTETSRDPLRYNTLNIVSLSGEGSLYSCVGSESSYTVGWTNAQSLSYLQYLFKNVVYQIRIFNSHSYPQLKLVNKLGNLNIIVF